MGANWPACQPPDRQREASEEEPTTTGNKTPHTHFSTLDLGDKSNFPPVATKLSFELSGVSQSKIRLGKKNNT